MNLERHPLIVLIVGTMIFAYLGACLQLANPTSPELGLFLGGVFGLGFVIGNWVSPTPPEEH